MDASHEQNRRKICLLCFCRTKSMFPIVKKLKEKVAKVYDYDANDERLPVVVCNGCRRDLYRLDDDPKKTVSFANTSKLSLKRVTRSNGNTPCNCKVCQFARMPRTDHFAKGASLPPRQRILKDITNSEIIGEYKKKLFSILVIAPRVLKNFYSRF